MWQSSAGAVRAIAIADGMGSKKYSRQGANAAVASALRAAKNWAAHPQIGTNWLIRWLEAEWRYTLGDLDPNDCGTTCWLAVSSPHAGLLVIGLGDGFALCASGDEEPNIISGRKDDDFSNETLALGVTHKSSDWKVRHFPSTPELWLVVLATDGVADDIRGDRIGSFLQWVKEISSLKHPARGIRRALKKWPVEAHTDDKTVAAITNH